MSLSSLIQEIEVSKYKIYCDLDGVITDFKSRYQHFTGLTPEEMDVELIKQYGEKKAKSIFWDKVNDVGPKFWEEMDFMSDAYQLINFIKPYGFKFLSSPSRSATSVEGKTNWAKKHFPNIELILRQANKKQEFSESNAILIDDKPSNIEQWKAKGGIGILHKSASDTIKQLEKLGFKNQVKEIQIKNPSILPQVLNLIKFLKENSNRWNGLERNINNLLLSFYYKNNIDLGAGDLKALPEPELKKLYEHLLKLKKFWEMEPDEDYAQDRYYDLDEIQIQSVVNREKVEELGSELLNSDSFNETWRIIKKYMPDNDEIYWPDFLIMLDRPQLNSFYKELLQVKKSSLQEIQIKKNYPKYFIINNNGFAKSTPLFKNIMNSINRKTYDFWSTRGSKLISKVINKEIDIDELNKKAHEYIKHVKSLNEIQISRFLFKDGDKLIFHLPNFGENRPITISDIQNYTCSLYDVDGDLLIQMEKDEILDMFKKKIITRYAR